MPLDRAISNLRQLHGFGMKSEAELRRVVVAVLEGVREPSEDQVAAGIAQGDECTDGWTVSAPCVAECLWPVMVAALIREASGEG